MAEAKRAREQAGKNEHAERKWTRAAWPGTPGPRWSRLRSAIPTMWISRFEVAEKRL